MQAFHLSLQQWYQHHGRQHLPWRNTQDAYAIYISEIMLQQTQVKTVLERYYFPFLERFPTITALAKAPQNEVLNAWQGLGYYNRALNLHKTAKLCPKGLPDSVEALMELPGIGRNTAHAVAVFAFRQPVAVMEANVKRVLARIFAMKQLNERDLWERAGELLDTSNPFDYNQAMMDLGSLVCTKTNPKCSECPAVDICQGNKTPELYPMPKQSKRVKVRRKLIAVLRNDRGEYYATPRSSRFLGGLFHFIEIDEQATTYFVGSKNYNIDKKMFLGAIRQQYSHFTLEADVYLVEAGKTKGIHWYSSDSLSGLPMSMAEHKILGLLEIPLKKALTG